MRNARPMIFALVTSFALAIGGSALAHPPGGSEDGSNNVSCHGSATGVPGTGLAVDAHGDGVGVCNDSGPLPIEGRVMVNLSAGYVAADGDSSNPAPLDGFARIGTSGSGCGDGNQDSHQGGDPSNCDGS